MDYRDLGKSRVEIDHVISVGMIEHVGNENYDLFLDQIKAFLTDQSVFLLNYISGLKEASSKNRMDKYIFPESVLPSLREVIHKGVEKILYYRRRKP